MKLDETTYLQQFERRELGPEHFDHIGHLRMAWLHLVHFGLEEGNVRVCRGIRDLAEKFGAPEKFNHTLTEALMRIMAQRMTATAAKDLERFLQANKELVDDAQGVLARHYSPERLASAAAKTGWVEPDREPI
jgi:hypothetical protein